MKSILTLAFLLTVTLTTFSQKTEGSNQTTSLCGGRWEFFMSDIAIRLTFKIDKFTGEVRQLVQLEDKTPTWMLVIKQYNFNNIHKKHSINYQLFSNGQGIRHTYLLNTNSGLTWQLVAGKNGVLNFQTIE